MFDALKKYGATTITGSLELFAAVIVIVVYPPAMLAWPMAYRFAVAL